MSQPYREVTVDALLSDPTVPALRRLTRRDRSGPLRRVFLAESVRDVEQAPPASLVVLSRAASSEAADYRLDMALRWASLRGAAALATFGSSGLQQSITALDLAERSHLALLSIPPDTDLALLIRAISRAIDAGAALALARAELALQAISAAEAAREDGGRLAELASAALGLAVEARDPGPEAYGVPVWSNGLRSAYSCELPPDWGLATAARLVLQSLAGASARLEERNRSDLDSPARSRSDLLGELLVADETHATDLLDWARRLGLPIDGWHVVVRIEVDNLARLQQDELGRLELLVHAAQDALRTAAAGGDGWYLARATGVVTLVHTTRADPGPRAGMADTAVARLALQGLGARFADAHFRAGVGAPHEGLAGLRASALEARAALLALGRVGPGQDPVMAFDAVGIRRMLLEWYSSATAREAVRVQLAPLEQLGPPKSDVAIRTLQTYLDNQGSVVRTAQVLHLHRNAVAYRLQRIFELLEVDASDPDQRLALQLACRARLLW